MANLFIIGNGFDIAHKLKTSYGYFKDWLNPIAEGIDFSMLREEIISKIVAREKDIMLLTSIIETALKKLSTEEIDRRELLAKQLQSDFNNINHWANFDTNNFDKIKLNSPYSCELIDKVRTNEELFTRELFLKRYFDFSEEFAKCKDKIMFDEAFEELSNLKTKIWNASKLEFSTAVFLFIELLNDIAGSNWSNIEESLGKLDTDKFLERFYPETDEISNTELIAIFEFILTAFSESLNLLNAWVYDTDISSVQKKEDFSALIQKDDHFFSTNYTHTIENVYGIDNVCHIHGLVRKISENDAFEMEDVLIFGHGNDVSELQNKKWRIDIESISNNGLKKPVGRCIVKHTDFFESLENVDTVYSYGFSFSDVDMPYISKICESIGDTSNVIWHLNDYNQSEHKEFKRKIRSSGFKGQFKTFHINYV